MGEVKRIVITRKVRFFCDGCFNEPSVGSVLTSHPPIYVHWCSYCKKEYRFNKSYPYIEYEEIDG
jgi:hypothetical protein